MDRVFNLWATFLYSVVGTKIFPKIRVLQKIADHVVTLLYIELSINSFVGSWGSVLVALCIQLFCRHTVAGRSKLSTIKRTCIGDACNLLSDMNNGNASQMTNLGQNNKYFLSFHIG